MALNTRFGTAVLLTPLDPSTVEVLRWHPRLMPAGQWDEADVDWLAFYEDGEEEAVFANTFPVGTAVEGHVPGGHKWWIAEPPDIELRAPGVMIARARLKGRQTAEDPIRYASRIGARTDTQSAENIEISSVVYPRVQVEEAALELEVRWTFIGSRPAVDIVGSAQTPPVSVTPRTTGWTSLANPLYHFPNGWVLASRDPEPVVQGVTGGWSVTDLYRYVYPNSP